MLENLSLSKAKEMLGRAHERAKAATKTMHRGAMIAVSTGISMGAAGLSGFANEKWGSQDKDGDRVVTVAGVDVDMLAGGAALIGGFLAGGLKESEYLNALPIFGVAHGGLDAFSYRQGVKMGRASRTSTTTTKGSFSEGGRYGAGHRYYNEQYAR